MSIREKSSGAARYGNFVNYYQFNKPEERAKLLPNSTVFRGWINKKRIVALDIGCNTGELTTCLYKYLTSDQETDVHILGVDLDSELIQRAQHSNSFPNAVCYMCLDVMNEKCQPLLLDYLKKFQQAHFDITFCFSVTMWVHLNHGDVGLKTFLETTCRCTDFLLLEAQTWKCYRNASRRMKREGKEAFQTFDSLSMNRNVVENICSYIEGKCKMEVFHCFGETAWNRKVTLYKKTGLLSEDKRN